MTRSVDAMHIIFIPKTKYSTLTKGLVGIPT